MHACNHTHMNRDTRVNTRVYYHKCRRTRTLHRYTVLYIYIHINTCILIYVSCAQLLDAIQARLPLARVAAFEALRADIGHPRRADPQGAAAASLRWRANQQRAHLGTSTVRHAHNDPAWGLAVDGRRIAHWNTWGRADSATDGDQLFTTAGQTSCTGARAAAYRRTPTELSYDARGRCVQGS